MVNTEAPSVLTRRMTINAALTSSPYLIASYNPMPPSWCTITGSSRPMSIKFSPLSAKPMVDHTLSPRSRLRGESVWSTIGFALNGLIFMLIGLELPVIVHQLGGIGLYDAIKYGLLVSAALIVIRLVSTLGASVFTMLVSHVITTADSHPGWRGPFIFGWAGMRGVVSLAAALSIPLHLSNGAPFPQR